MEIKFCVQGVLRSAFSRNLLYKNTFCIHYTAFVVVHDRTLGSSEGSAEASAEGFGRTRVRFFEGSAEPFQIFGGTQF